MGNFSNKYFLFIISILGSKKICEECEGSDIYKTKSNLLDGVSYENSINQKNKL